MASDKKNNAVHPVSIQKDNSDCFVCLTKPFVRLTSLTGLGAIQSSCPHCAKHFSQKQIVQKSKFHWVLAVLYVIVLLYYIGYGFYLVIHCRQKIECFELISEFIFSINALSSVFFSLKLNNLRLKELNSWITLFENKNKFGFKTILDAETINYLTRFGRKCCIFVFILITAYSCICLLSLFFTTCDFEHVSRRTSSIFSIYVQLIVIFEFSNQHVFLKHINNVCYSTIIRSMCDVLPINNNLVLENSKVLEGKNYMIESNSLEMKLSNMIKYHSAITDNMYLLQKFVSSSMVIWITLTLVILVMNIYVMIKTALASNYSLVVILLEIKTYSIIVSIIYLLTIIEKTTNQVSYCLSFYTE